MLPVIMEAQRKIKFSISHILLVTGLWMPLWLWGTGDWRIGIIGAIVASCAFHWKIWRIAQCVDFDADAVRQVVVRKLRW